jgi:hypothetical protein
MHGVRQCAAMRSIGSLRHHKGDWGCVTLCESHMKTTARCPRTHRPARVGAGQHLFAWHYACRCCCPSIIAFHMAATCSQQQQ